MSDVLIDTSGWIEFFRNPHSPCASAVDLLLAEERVCTTSLILVEVVSGARSRTEFERLRRDFTALPQVDFPQEAWADMLESRWQLKMKGITGISIPDLLVAHVALIHRKAILTLDRDFQRMQVVLGLMLVEIEI